MKLITPFYKGSLDLFLHRMNTCFDNKFDLILCVLGTICNYWCRRTLELDFIRMLTSDNFFATVRESW